MIVVAVGDFLNMGDTGVHLNLSTFSKRSIQKGTNSDFILYKPPGKPRKVYIAATKAIKKDTEILAWYGREYVLDNGKAVTR